MNLIIESAQEVESKIETFLDENKQEQKAYYIEGIFSTTNTKNQNGRIYPTKLWETEVERYQNEIRNKTINSLGEWEHPNRRDVDPMKAVMRIVELKMDGHLVRGKAKILDNNSPETNQLKTLIREGMKIGVSSRGFGKIGANNIIESYRLITFDAVANPSDYNANLDGIYESMIFENGVCRNFEYFIDEENKIQQKKIYSVDGFRLSKELSNLIKLL